MAKLGSKMNKPDGLTVIHPEKVADILKDLPLDKLHGIGEKTRNYLNYLGMIKAGELGEAPLSLLTAHFGLGGHILRAMGRGIDNAPVPYYWQQDEIKSISHTYTLPFDTSNIGIIRAYILMLCQRVTTRLHEKGKSARTVALIIRYNDFETFSRRKAVSYLLDAIHEIYQICLRILADIGELRKPIRLLGVAVSGLDGTSRQLCLLEILEKERELSKAVGKINNRYGEFTIKPASIMFAERFELLHGNEGWMPVLAIDFSIKN
jgi:DNA polymerase-4